MKFSHTIWILLLATRVLGLEVRESLWGFDRRVVPEHFNMLSLLVVNPSAQAFEGKLRLQQGYGQGAEYAETVFLAPHGARWVQFFPYVASREEKWRLSWGSRANEAVELAEAKLGPPARVYLHDPDSPRTPPPGFCVFAEGLFPATVAGTDGLGSVILDHAPRWEAARRTAFLDWIRRGGTLHVLRDAEGQYPVFGDELGALNLGTNQFELGAGRVIRHAPSRGEFRDIDLTAAGYPACALEEGKELAVWQFADSIFAPLNRLVQPHHPWWLIGLLSLVYMAVVGPGVVLFENRRRNYRLTLALLLGCVVVFGVLLAYAGRRGQGEAGMVHSLAYARGLSGDEYQVTQWVNVFVTRGDYYAFQHEARHNLYAVPQAYERVNGVVEGGREGRLRVDIPLYSQRGFAHQAKLKGVPLEVCVQFWPGPAPSDFAGTQFAVGPDFPRQPLQVWACYRNSLWPMRLLDDRLVVSGAGEELERFFSAEKLRGQDNDAAESAVADVRLEQAVRQLAPCLMAWGLGGTTRFRYYVPSADAGAQADGEHIRLFVLARSPAGFRMHGTPVGTEVGHVLYDLRLGRPQP